MPLDEPTRGLLLFCHGARDPNWALPFEAVARRAREFDPSTQVQLAFLEFMTPDLLTAGSALVADGCRHIDVVPLFLGAGGHVRKDLPALMAELHERHPQVRFHLHRAVGEQADVVEAMARVSVAMAAEATSAGSADRAP
jgi:sirohydrochlorin cobaltochelatase